MQMQIAGIANEFERKQNVATYDSFRQRLVKAEICGFLGVLRIEGKCPSHAAIGTGYPRMLVGKTPSLQNFAVGICDAKFCDPRVELCLCIQRVAVATV